VALRRGPAGARRVPVRRRVADSGVCAEPAAPPAISGVASRRPATQRGCGCPACPRCGASVSERATRIPLARWRSAPTIVRGSSEERRGSDLASLAFRATAAAAARAMRVTFRARSSWCTGRPSVRAHRRAARGERSTAMAGCVSAQRSTAAIEAAFEACADARLVGDVDGEHDRGRAGGQLVERRGEKGCSDSRSMA
jgi:hypothetical protein